MHNVAERLNFETATKGQLISYIDRLEYELSEYRLSDDPSVKLRSIFGLTKQQSVILGALVDGRTHTRTALIGRLSEWGMGTTDIHLSVVICNLRKKLPDNIHVKNVWGLGYRLDEESMAAIKDCLNDPDVASKQHRRGL